MSWCLKLFFLRLLPLLLLFSFRSLLTLAPTTSKHFSQTCHCRFCFCFHFFTFVTRSSHTFLPCNLSSMLAILNAKLLSCSFVHLFGTRIYILYARLFGWHKMTLWHDRQTKIRCEHVCPPKMFILCVYSQCTQIKALQIFYTYWKSALTRTRFTFLATVLSSTWQCTSVRYIDFGHFCTLNIFSLVSCSSFLFYYFFVCRPNQRQSLILIIAPQCCSAWFRNIFNFAPEPGFVLVE